MVLYLGRLFSSLSVLKRSAITNNNHLQCGGLVSLANRDLEHHYYSTSKQTIEERIGVPPRPKRPLTPYLKYASEVRPKVKARFPDSSLMELSKKIAGMWKSEVSEETKASLSQSYRKESEEFIATLEKYNSKLTEEQRNTLLEAKKSTIEGRKKSRIQKKIVTLNRPKKPVSAYASFMQDTLKHVSRSDLKTAFADSVKAWNSLSEERKAVYTKTAEEASAKYAAALLKWETQMYKEGHSDVIRVVTLKRLNSIANREEKAAKAKKAPRKTASKAKRTKAKTSKAKKPAASAEKTAKPKKTVS